eukprot:1838250-Amphidinium_carterae.1
MKDGICLGDHIRANATQYFVLALRCHALSLTKARNNYNFTKSLRLHEVTNYTVPAGTRFGGIAACSNGETNAMCHWTPIEGHIVTVTVIVT